MPLLKKKGSASSARIRGPMRGPDDGGAIVRARRNRHSDVSTGAARPLACARQPPQRFGAVYRAQRWIAVGEGEGATGPGRTPGYNSSPARSAAYVRSVKSTARDRIGPPRPNLYRLAVIVPSSRASRVDLDARRRATRRKCAEIRRFRGRNTRHAGKLHGPTERLPAADSRFVREPSC